MFNPVIVLLVLGIGLLIVGHVLYSALLCWVGLLEVFFGIILFVDIIFRNYLIEKDSIFY